MQEARESPALVLIESSNPVARIAAHLELAHRARAREDVDIAAMHYREALELDPTDERSRDALQRMGLLRAPDDAPARKSFWSWLGGRRARK